MKVSYNWLQHHFTDKLPSIEEMDSVIALQAFETEGIEEIGDDKILDIDVLPNRAHDCLSHRGIATEFAGLSGLKLKSFDERYFYDKEPAKSDLVPSVTIENTDQCRRYMGRIIENIKVAESPQWLKDRIETLGQRSINNVVDATNYVMFDTGNPIHAFDMDKVTDGGIVVRNAQDGEMITTLGRDQIEAELDDSMLVIADSEGALAIAGIKGGKKAEVDDKTVNLILEVANFEPLSTRKTRQKTGITTDSSKRFENELSPELVTEAMDAITKMVIEVASTDDTKVGDIVDEYPNPVSPWTVSVSTEHTNRLLGTSLSDSDIANIFDRYNWKYEQDGDVFTVTPPALRLDLQIAEDLIEEIGRIYGYANIDNADVAQLSYEAQVNPNVYHVQQLRNILTDAGFTEVMTYTFVNKGHVETTNALASDKGALRKNLSKSLAEARERNAVNAELFGDDTVRMFEIGSVFGKEGEHVSLGITVGNKKGVVQKEIDTVQALLSEKIGIDVNGEVNDGVLEINITELIIGLKTGNDYSDYLQPESVYTNATYHPFSNQPFMTRDIAVWVTGNNAQSELLDILQSADLLAREPRLVDEFTKDDRTSYAYRLVFQANDRTLTDDEVNAIMDDINMKIANKGWEVR
jgi:phenylalanyl-tRNA synthetase beta chain